MTYPGSTSPLRAPAEAVAAVREQVEQSWDTNPQYLFIDGKEREFFPIGALALALNRDANTLREWEQLDYLPRASWRTATKDATAGERKKHGQKRLYSRKQIEGLREIAVQEGILDFTRQIGRTNFPARARHLFEELRSSSED